MGEQLLEKTGFVRAPCSKVGGRLLFEAAVITGKNVCESMAAGMGQWPVPLIQYLEQGPFVCITTASFQT